MILGGLGRTLGRYKNTERERGDQRPEKELNIVRYCRVAKQASGMRVMANTLSMVETTQTTPTSLEINPYEVVSQLVSSNAVVVFSMSGCCMCTVAKRLLFGLGVGPTIIELDHHASGADIKAILFQLLAAASNVVQQPVPAVFVGGKFLGGIETLMACHINGSLVPLLKDAGALWL